MISASYTIPAIIVFTSLIICVVVSHITNKEKQAVVIKKGQHPREKVYQSSCGCCGSVFRFKKSWCNQYSTRLEGLPITEIKCPLCDKVAVHPCGLSRFEVD